MVGTGGPGDPVIALLRTPTATSPVLVQLKSEEGHGHYRAVTIGTDPASGSYVLKEVQVLSDAGRLPAALELVASVVHHLPRSPARAELLALAGRLAQGAAPSLRASDLPRFERTARLLGVPPFVEEGGELRYQGAFEQRVEGKGPVAEEAALRALRLAEPCTPSLVAERVEVFVGRFPTSRRLGEVRLWRARALELELAALGYRDPTLRREAIAAWGHAASGASAAEAKAAFSRLHARLPPRTPPVLPAVCPDPGAD